MRLSLPCASFHSLPVLRAKTQFIPFKLHGKRDVILRAESLLVVLFLTCLRSSSSSAVRVVTLYSDLPFLLI